MDNQQMKANCLLSRQICEQENFNNKFRSNGIAKN